MLAAAAGESGDADAGVERLPERDTGRGRLDRHRACADERVGCRTDEQLEHTRFDRVVERTVVKPALVSARAPASSGSPRGADGRAAGAKVSLVVSIHGATFTLRGETPGRTDRHASTVTSTPIAASLSAYRSVTTGMQTVEARAEGDASQIATRGPDVSSIVDLDVQKDTLSALAGVFRATDEMTVTAVDLLA
jgi:hypothetical protein